jgi:hypothetical protein
MEYQAMDSTNSSLLSQLPESGQACQICAELFHQHLWGDVNHSKMALDRWEQADENCPMCQLIFTRVKGVIRSGKTPRQHLYVSLKSRNKAVGPPHRWYFEELYIEDSDQQYLTAPINLSQIYFKGWT